jgi:septum formation protein
MMPKLILASGSPRRKDLLTEAGYDFQVIVPDVEENEDVSVPIRQLTKENAELKAEAVSPANTDAVVIAADTLVLLEERVLTKPIDGDEAREMLASLNGKSHQVFTAFSILHGREGKRVLETVTTDVHFKLLTEAEMIEYHKRINPMDKAGAYAAQEHGKLIIDRIEGSMTNVIGLPMRRLAEILESDFGIVPTLR